LSLTKISLISQDIKRRNKYAKVLLRLDISVPSVFISKGVNNPESKKAAMRHLFKIGITFNLIGRHETKAFYLAFGKTLTIKQELT
jgi:hypothetical protein